MSRWIGYWQSLSEGNVTWNTTSKEARLPRSWPGYVKSAMLQAISLAQLAITYARARGSKSRSVVVRLGAELERACHEVSQLIEELRIKDTRMTLLESRV